MKELVELIARGLVDYPDEVRVREVQNDRGIVYELSVAPSDMGKVIGKSGRLAKSMRTVVSAAALQYNQRVSIEIV
jgi:predicted RNA-binding protein YlqC (UPF0109 family)